MLGKSFSQDKAVTFNDGILRGIEIINGEIVSNITGYIPFGIQTVGFERFYRSLNQDMSINKMVTIPFEYDVSECVFLEVGSYRLRRKPEIFRIVQIQELKDSKPPCLQISLSKDTTDYDDLRRVTDGESEGQD